MKSKLNRPRVVLGSLETLELTSRIVLLGTLHNDPDGFKKALAVFLGFKPDLILVELSPFARVFRKKHRSRLDRILRSNLKEATVRLGISFQTALEHPQIKSIRSQIAQPFEYMAAVAYMLGTGPQRSLSGRLYGAAFRSHPRLLLVDSSNFSKRMVATWPDLITIENLGQLLSLPFEKDPHIKQLYHRASSRIASKKDAGLDMMRWNDEQTMDLWQDRELYIARQIKTALIALKPERPLYIGGWWHLTSGGRVSTLRDLLQIPVSRCFLLDGILTLPATDRKCI